MAENETRRPSTGDALQQASGVIVTERSDITPDERRALEVAHRLVDAGIPVFVAHRNHGDGPEFHYPKDWQHYRPSHGAVDRWKRGAALCMVTGVKADVIDTDPRNGGEAGRAELDAVMPPVFGVSATPSGGTHEVIPRTGLAKGKPAEGVDLQAGDDRGEGRGFVFIAPTVRVAKDGPGKGRPVAYRWTREPDLDALATAEAPTALVERIRAGKAPRQAPSTPVDSDDPFDSPSGIWTPEQAERVIGAQLQAVQNAHNGSVNDTLGGAARVLGRFVAGGHLTEQEATTRLLEALERGGVHSDAWNLANRKGWTAATVIGAALANGAKEPWQVVEETETRNPHAYESVAWFKWENEREAEAKRDKVRDRMRAKLFDRDGIDSIPPPTPIIDGVLDVSTVAFLSGKFGTYKTFVAVAWACSVATGRPWEGREVVTPGPVIYVAAEGVSGIRARVGAWEIGHNGGQRVPHDRLYVLNGKVRLNVPEEISAFSDIIREIKPALVVVDTLHQCAAGSDENSNTEMGSVFGALGDLREEHGATLLALHHTGHSGERARGASSLEDDADTAWIIKLDDAEDRSASVQRTLIHRKTKDGELLAPMDLALELVDGTGSGYVTEGTVPQPGAMDHGIIAEKVIEALDGMGVPVSAGRERCRKALGTSFRVGNDVLADAVRQRKERARSAE
jgi:hypothetical protein